MQVAKRRLKQFRARRKRFGVLKRSKVDVSKILRTGGTAALTFGQETMGVSTSMLLAQRRSVAASLRVHGH
eukprot:12248929-Karenia_brevis.AAC.1